MQDLESRMEIEQIRRLTVPMILSPYKESWWEFLVDMYIFQK